MNTFQLRQTTNGSVSCFDILIDDKPLAAYFAGRLGAIPDLISPLGPVESELAQYRREQFERFLLERKPDFPAGRNSILVCQLCGDLGCGAYTAKFQREHDLIKWTAFGYENNYDSASVQLEPYKTMPDFVFSWTEFEAELRRHLTSDLEF